MRESVVIHNLDLVFSGVVSLELVENRRKVVFRCWQLTKLIVPSCAPEKTAFREAIPITAIHSNHYKIVILET